jgi:hypothetical protein
MTKTFPSKCQSTLTRQEIYEIFSKYSSASSPGSNNATPTIQNQNPLEISLQFPTTPSPTASVEDLLVPFPGSSPRLSHPSLPLISSSNSVPSPTRETFRSQSHLSGPLEKLRHRYKRSFKLSDPTKFFNFSLSPPVSPQDQSFDQAGKKDDQPKGMMNLDEFTSFLLSGYNSPFEDEFLKNGGHVEDLKRPLNEYFISSSHNVSIHGLIPCFPIDKMAN